jgi:dipeptidyl aminopeptidase/acylaminoacyl peptidase
VVSQAAQKMEAHMRLLKNLVCSIAIVLLMGQLCFLTGVSAQSQRISLSDLGNLVGLNDPQISPDGKQIALVVSRPDYEENRHANQIVLIDVATRTHRALTYDRSGVGHPRWSRDGTRIAFLDADREKKHQVFVMAMNGGEAKRVTNSPTGVGQFAWRPNGRDIAFVAEDEAAQKSGEEKHNKSFEVGDDMYLVRKAALPAHIWLIASEGGTATRLTSGIEGVSTFHSPSLEWSPDGSTIAFLSQPLPQTGQAVRDSIKILDVAQKSVRTIFSGFPGPWSVSFSPAGDVVAFSRSRGAEPGFNPAALYTIPLAGGQERALSSEIDRNLSGSWLPGGKGMLMTGADRTRLAAWVQPVGGPPRKLDLGGVDPVSGVSIAPDGSLAFVGVQPQRPGEVYFLKSVDSRPERLTDFNATITSRQLGKVETVTWNLEGFEENGVLILPPDFDSGKKYPLVLDIHGGPMGTSTEGFGGMATVMAHTMAAQGWIVFMPNYRGSSNMGQAYQRAVVNDAGDGPGRDVMAGVAAVKARGIVDDSRIAVSGWSYGGYMTAWLTGHYQGWAAAVAGAAVTDWFDWYDLADMNVWAGYGLGGSPWLNDNAANYWKQSPIAYAHKIRTPTLILSDTEDPRVTVTQSYKLYHALKDNGVQVQFIAYPIPGHFPADPVHQRDVFRRWIDWIDRHFASGVSRQGTQ